MGQEFLEILIFEVDGQRHGLPVAQIRELLPALSILPVPGDPDGIEGVINLRGVIVPVVDARRRFGLPARALAVADHFIVAQAGSRLLALHVDRALELTRAETPAFDPERRTQVVKLADGMVILHQVEDFLPPAREVQRS